MTALGGCQSDTQETQNGTQGWNADPTTMNVAGQSLGKNRSDATAGTYTRSSRAEALTAYRRISGLESQEHTFDVVGTRRLASTWPMVPRGGPNPSLWRYDHSGSQQLFQSIRLGFLEQPPNVVPVLKAIPTIQSSSTSETFRIGVKLASQPAGTWLMSFGAAPDTESHTLYEEVYLHEWPYGSSGRGKDALTHPTIEVHAAIDDEPTAGFVFADSILALEWEVI